MRSNKEETSLSWVKDILALCGLTATNTLNPYEQYDLDCSNGGIIEVKERWLDKDKFNKYSSEGFILEDTKYQFLLGKKSLYCNLFDYGETKIALFWNINTLQSNSVSLNCKATTTFKNNSYKNKQVHLINIDQCSYIYLYENDEWIRSDKETVMSKLTN